MTTASVAFSGDVVAVKARIRLLRSFDEVSESVTTWLAEPLPVESPNTEWAEFDRATGLTVVSRGRPHQDRRADPEGGPLDRAGAPRQVPGRKGDVWIDDHVERDDLDRDTHPVTP